MSARVTATVVCCILMQIVCVVSQKSFSFWGTSSPRPPTGALLRTPRWGTSVPQIPSLPLCPPNNPVRSTPLTAAVVYTHARRQFNGNSTPLHYYAVRVRNGSVMQLSGVWLSVCHTGVYSHWLTRDSTQRAIWWAGYTFRHVNTFVVITLWRGANAKN